MMPDTMSDLHYFRKDWIQNTDRTLTCDICIYGGTSAGVVAAVTAQREGKKALLLHPGKILGGLTTGGLGCTDWGKKHAIGGISRDFYRRVGKKYGIEEEFLFEPHVAAAVYDDLLKEANVPVELCQYLDSVEITAGRITALHMLGGLTVKASVFLDTTYEGDLLAKTGVSFTVGRESNQQYGETLNGVQVKKTHQFSGPGVDAYLRPGDPSSGVLPFVLDRDQTQHIGEGDRLVQAYNFRICMTNDPALRVAWEKPQDFHPEWYELVARWMLAPKDDYNEVLPLADAAAGSAPRKFDIFPHKTPGGFLKTDTNNHGAVSSDFIGANHDWPEAGYEAREKIFQAHVSWQKGYYWFLANDPRVPQHYQQAYRQWGLARDEFLATAHWSHALYVREARRMVGDSVITEHDCMHRRQADDSIGMGSYNMDSHNCCRFVKDGYVYNDGDVQAAPQGAYRVSYRCIVPRKGECQNLLVPVCLSSSHIAYGSVRMEPVFMVLAQSAALAACVMLDRGVSAQDVPYRDLEPRLIKANQVIRL